MSITLKRRTSKVARSQAYMAALATIEQSRTNKRGPKLGQEIEKDQKDETTYPFIIK